MKRYSKLLALLVVAFMAITVTLAGCGQAATPATAATTAAAAETTAAPAATTAAAKAPIDIQWWQFWDVGDEADSIKSAIDDFNTANPDIKVTATKLGWGDGFTRIQTAIGAGTAPDVLELGSTWVGAFADVGALTDLKSMITPEIKDKFINWNLGEQPDGSVVAFPWAVGTRALAVNNDLMKKAGITAAPKDWNELMAMAKAIKAKCGVPGFNIPAGDPTGDYQGFGAFLYSAGGAYIVKNDKNKWVSGVGSDASKKALQYYMSILPYASADNEANATLAFENNKLGSFIVGSYLTASMMKDGKAVTDWSYETIPACPDTGKTFAFNGAEVLTIPMQAKNKDASFKVLTYLADEKTAMKICQLCGWSILPSTKTVGDLDVFKNPPDEPAKRVAKFIEIAKAGNTFAPPIQKSIEDIGMRISTMVQDVVLNKTAIDKATKSADDDINKIYLK